MLGVPARCSLSPRVSGVRWETDTGFGRPRNNGVVVFVSGRFSLSPAGL